MKHNIYLVLLIIGTQFLSCKKNTITTSPPSSQAQQKSSQKSITSYAFLKINNPTLASDVIGTISGSNISVAVPSDSSKSLIATFTNSDKSKVYIGNVQQQSGTTTNDFSQKVNYKVIAEDSSISTYSVNVTFPPKSSQKILLTFSFLKINNPTIPSDIVGNILGNNISITVPSGLIRTNLNATFTNSDKSKVYIGKVLQQSGVSVNNFTQTVNYTIIAEDSSIATYSINLVTDTFPELDNYLTSVMANFNVPGITVAIVKNDKLVYTNAYGYAIKETNQKTTNDNLFRIASVSKTITAITILKLAQEGLLNLNQTVFGTNGILVNDYGVPPAGSNKDKITIQNLLDHKSGWTDIPADPMTQNLNWDFTQLITDMVLNRPLTYYPGDTSIYLNFGYCVLGRIIEKVTGQSYEQYVQDSILALCGISQMRIGGNTLADRYPNEVEYYSSNAYSPYGPGFTRLDACAGWIASATDLARYISRIDREPYRPDILTNATLQQMYFGYYNWAFVGELQGNNSIISRLDDNFSFVVLLNENIGNQMEVLYQSVGDIIHQRQSWPTYDLF